MLFRSEIHQITMHVKMIVLSISAQTDLYSIQVPEQMKHVMTAQRTDGMKTSVLPVHAVTQHVTAQAQDAVTP